MLGRTEKMALASSREKGLHEDGAASVNGMRGAGGGATTKATASPPESGGAETFRYSGKDQEKWDAHFANLVIYNAKYGHCNVPYCNSGLGNWVGYQRRQYKLYLEEQKSFICPQRIQQLELLQFPWKSPRSRQKPGAKRRKPHAPFVDWETRFQQLCEYRQQNGDCLVPQKYLKNPPLGKWVHKQRCNQRVSLKSDTTKLSKERIALLDSIDFVWIVNARKVDWEGQFDSLLRYKRAHGHCNVCHQDGVLGEWVSEQRQDFQQFKRRGKEDSISSIVISRFEKLKAVGFQFVLTAADENAPTDGATGKFIQSAIACNQGNTTCSSSTVSNLKRLVEAVRPEAEKAAHFHQGLEKTGGTKRRDVSAVAPEKDTPIPQALKRNRGVETASPATKASCVGIHESKTETDDLRMAKAALIQNLQAYRLYIETYARVPHLYKHAIDISVLIGHLEGGTTSFEGITSGPIRGSLRNTHAFTLPIQNKVHITKKGLIQALGAFRALAMKSSDPLICAHGCDARVLIRNLEEGAF